MRVIEGGFGPKACSNLSSDLREMADAVDRGEIVDMVIAWTQDDKYKMIHSCSLINSLVLSALLQRSSVDAFGA